MSKSQPIVSVVMAVYNGERFLRQAVDSILGQTFTDFELIVVDDGSKDATPAILDEYEDGRIVRLRNQTNIGQTPSLNIGIEAAKGQFIARHDADDVSHPERFARQAAFLQEHTAVGLLGTSYRLVDDQGKLLEIEHPPPDNAGLQARLTTGNCLCHGSVMMRRDSLQAAGLYRPAFRVTQDYDLWLRLAEVTQLANLEQPLYDFRFDGGSVSRNKRGLQLAYRQLAWQLAAQRRAGQPESPFPEDVLQAFPADTERLLGDARRSAYLFFAAGQMPQAEEAALEVRQLLAEAPVSAAVWRRWMLSRARALADLRQSAAVGAAFIEWFTAVLPEAANQLSPNQLLGEFYAESAFAAFQQAERKQVTAHAWQAVRHDWHWVGNKGLLAIAGRSLLG